MADADRHIAWRQLCLVEFADAGAVAGLVLLDQDCLEHLVSFRGVCPSIKTKTDLFQSDIQLTSHDARLIPLSLAAVPLAVLAEPGPGLFILSRLSLDGRRREALWTVLAS